MMQRLLTFLGLALMAIAVPALAIDSPNETPTLKAAPPSPPPVTPAPVSPPVVKPNASGSGDTQSTPAQPSMKDYCREHTC
jgi:hypothetical protein